MDRDQRQLHAQVRLEEALQHVEEAQRELGRAAEQLSSIVGGSPSHARLMKLYDRVHKEWYALRDRGRGNARWFIDDLAVSWIERRAVEKAVVK